MKLVVYRTICLVLLVLISIKSTGQVNEESRKFKSTTIGTQVWMVKNLDVVTFRNGDSIREVRSSEEWYWQVCAKNPLGVFMKMTSKLVNVMVNCIIGLQLLIQEVWRPMVGIYLLIRNGKCCIIL